MWTFRNQDLTLMAWQTYFMEQEPVGFNMRTLPDSNCFPSVVLLSLLAGPVADHTCWLPTTFQVAAKTAPHNTHNLKDVPPHLKKKERRS